MALRRFNEQLGDQLRMEAKAWFQKILPVYRLTDFKTESYFSKTHKRLKQKLLPRWNIQKYFILLQFQVGE